MTEQCSLPGVTENLPAATLVSGSLPRLRAGLDALCDPEPAFAANALFPSACYSDQPAFTQAFRHVLKVFQTEPWRSMTRVVIVIWWRNFH